MSQPYPIVSQSQLGEPVRSGLLGWGSPRRTADEVPPLQPHEVLVYRVNGHFVVDDGRHGRNDGRVVNATSVSVVNVQRGADVEVVFEIASMDAAKFTVQVNFRCSVIDAVTVVKDGQKNATEVLLSYLRGYQPLFELGLRHPLSDVNTVRRKAGFHVKAYVTQRAPEIPGLSIALSNVQVLTPEELGTQEEERRQAEREQARKEREQRAGQLLKLREQENAHLLDRLRAQHDIDQAGTIAEANGDDPRRAVLLAHVRGEITADDYARRLRELDEEDRRQQREIDEIERAEAREKAAIERQDSRDDAAIAHADDRLQLEWELSEKSKEKEFERAMAQENAEEEREQRKRAVDVELEILREFNKRGLLDNYYVDINDMIRRIRGESAIADASATRLTQREAPSELPTSDGGGDADNADDLEDDDLKEEDGY